MRTPQKKANVFFNGQVKLRIIVLVILKVIYFQERCVSCGLHLCHPCYSNLPGVGQETPLSHPVGGAATPPQNGDEAPRSEMVGGIDKPLFHQIECRIFQQNGIHFG
jgi:hypothetical protein